VSETGRGNRVAYSPSSAETLFVCVCLFIALLLFTNLSF